MDNFIYKFQVDKALCDDMITYHKNDKYYKMTGGTLEGVDKKIKDSIDVLFFNQTNHPTIIEYFKSLTKGLNEYINQYELVGNYRSNYKNSIQYYPPGGGFKVWHYERGKWGQPDNITAFRGLVYMTYLNDVKKGGETEFKYQKLKIKPEKGLSLIWPTDFTHTHRGIVAPDEEKWITTGWFNLV
jgi:hypothetical protein